MKVMTQRELINAALLERGLTPKDMCEALNFNYESFKSMVRRDRFGTKKAILICDFLGLDLRTLQTAPIKSMEATNDD